MDDQAGCSSGLNRKRARRSSVEAFDNQRFHRTAVAATEAVDLPLTPPWVRLDFADLQFRAANLASVIIVSGIPIIQ